MSPQPSPCPHSVPPCPSVPPVPHSPSLCPQPPRVPCPPSATPCPPPPMSCPPCPICPHGCVLTPCPIPCPQRCPRCVPPRPPPAETCPLCCFSDLRTGGQAADFEKFQPDLNQPSNRSDPGPGGGPCPPPPRPCPSPPQPRPPGAPHPPEGGHRQRGGVAGGSGGSPRVRVSVQCESRGDVMDPRGGRGTPSPPPSLRRDPPQPPGHRWTLRGGDTQDNVPPRPKCAPCWGARGGHWSPPRPSCFSWDSLEHGGGPAAFAPPQKDSAPHRGDPRDHRHGGGDPKCPPPFPLSATIAGWGGTTPEPLPSPAGDGGAPAPLPPPGNGGHRLAPLCGVTPVPPNAPSPPPSPGLSPSLGRGGHTGVPPLICKYPPPPNHSISVGLGHPPHPPPQPPAPPSRAGGGVPPSLPGVRGGDPL